MPHLLPRLAASLLLCAAATTPATAAPPPKPRPKPVRPSIVGDWRLDVGPNVQASRILFRADGSYRLLWACAGVADRDWEGEWKLEGDRLELTWRRFGDDPDCVMRGVIDLRPRKLESCGAAFGWGERWRLTPWGQAK